MFRTGKTTVHEIFTELSVFYKENTLFLVSLYIYTYIYFKSFTDMNFEDFKNPWHLWS